jgi:Holliday junction resolvasome RuvABC endonuclease subunit
MDGVRLDGVRRWSGTFLGELRMAAVPARDTTIYRHGVTNVLGVDPAMTVTGYAILRGDQLVDAGKISTSARDSEPVRLWILFHELTALIREFHVDQMSVEEFVAFYRSSRKRDGGQGELPGLPGAAGGARRGKHDRESANPRSMFMMKGAQTVTQLSALVTGTPLSLYPVAEWKGGNRVSKEAIRARAQLLYRVPTQDHNITDAVMIAHHHVHHGRLIPDRQVSIPEEQLDRWMATLGARKPRASALTRTAGGAR